MTDPEIANTEQHDFWNGDRGRAWVARADQFDAQLEIYALRAVAGLAPAPGARLLDVGCGAGATTFEAARAVGTGGSVVGVDLSAPLLDLARARATTGGFANVAFQRADAQAMPPAETPYDGALSRFGVMFFDDPVGAFANIARSLVTGARMAFVCWGEPHHNQWLVGPAALVADIVPPTAADDPTAPGPFAFADAVRTAGLLEEAGWTDVSTEDITESIYLGGPGTVDDAVDFVVNGSALATPLAEAGAEATDEVRRRLTESFAAQHDGTGVRFPALARLVVAHTS